MKLKNFFNSQRRNDFFQELKNDFNPILEKVTVPVKTYAKSNPKKTLLLMISIVIANIILLFFFTDAFKTKEGSGLNRLKFPDQKHSVNNGTVPDIVVSFENIRKVKAMKDTLAYLLSLKRMTFQDTLTFVRIMDEFQKISSGTSGIPTLRLEDLRKSGQIGKPAIDSTIK